MITISILIAIIGLLLLWLTTVKIIKPPAGGKMMVGIFNKPLWEIGNTLPVVKITAEMIDLTPEELNEIQPKVDFDCSWFLTIWPLCVIPFDYRYKHYKTIKEIRDSKGSIVWQPTLQPDGKENTPDTIALGEWKEEMKTMLWIEEREDLSIKFTSKDPIRGSKKAYMRIIVWNMPLYTKSIRNPKEDAEKKTIDLFQAWSRDKPYFENIQGIGFASVNHGGITGDVFIKNLNKEIYRRGFIVAGIDLFEDSIEPGSQDVYDAKEMEKKETLLKNAAIIKSDILEIEGQGLKKKEMLLNEAVVLKDKQLKQNEVDQHRQNLENEKNAGLAIFEKETEIAVDANKKILNKVKKLKKTPDATLQKKYTAIQLSKIHTYVEGGGDSPVDKLDENISAHLKANLITFPKPKGGS